MVRATGAAKHLPGQLNTTVVIGGQTISPGDQLIMDADGVVAIAPHRLDEVTKAAQRRSDSEEAIRERLKDGELTIDILGLRPTR